MGVAPDSESELYRRMLRHRRYAYHRHARVLLTSGISILVAVGMVLLGFVFTRARLQHAPLLMINIGILCFLGVGSVVMIVAGAYFWRQAHRVVDEQEERLFRQRERRRLFRMAQGRLPWGYRRVTQILLVCVGIILVVVGGIILHFFGLQAWDGWGYSTLGMMIIFVSLVALPRAGQRIRQESADRLANYLLIGESRVSDTSESAEERGE
jgi:membrane protease YdiL (CAAX protease family)